MQQRAGYLKGRNDSYFFTYLIFLICFSRVFIYPFLNYQVFSFVYISIYSSSCLFFRVFIYPSINNRPFSFVYLCINFLSFLFHVFIFTFLNYHVSSLVSLSIKPLIIVSVLSCTYSFIR